MARNACLRQQRDTRNSTNVQKAALFAIVEINRPNILRQDWGASAMQVTVAQAKTVIAAGEAKAAAIGIGVIVAVLDAGAHLKAFIRMDGAVLGSIDLATAKARTAVLFQIPSEAVWDYCKPGAPAPGLERSNGGLATFAGGIPLFHPSGVMIGAVGVSGGAVSQDLEIARAAAAALQDYFHAAQSSSQ
jgi:uncharacterized protein GlcG (DUF336 family)